MALKKLITQARMGLFDLFKLVLRGVIALCSAYASILMAADISTPDDGSNDEPTEVDGDEAKSFGWNSW